MHPRTFFSYMWHFKEGSKGPIERILGQTDWQKDHHVRCCLWRTTCRRRRQSLGVCCTFYLKRQLNVQSGTWEKLEHQWACFTKKENNILCCLNMQKNSLWHLNLGHIAKKDGKRKRRKFWKNSFGHILSIF